MPLISSPFFRQLNMTCRFQILEQLMAVFLPCTIHMQAFLYKAKNEENVKTYCILDHR